MQSWILGAILFAVVGLLVANLIHVSMLRRSESAHLDRVLGDLHQARKQLAHLRSRLGWQSFRSPDKAQGDSDEH